MGRATIRSRWNAGTLSHSTEALHHQPEPLSRSNKNALFHKEISSEARSSDLSGLRMRDVLMGTEAMHISHTVFSFTLHSRASSSAGCSTRAGVLRLLRRGVLHHGQMEWEPTATQQRQPLVDEELMTVAPPHPAGEQVIRPLWAGFGPSQGIAAAVTLSHPREVRNLLPQPLSRSIKLHFC